MLIKTDHPTHILKETSIWRQDHLGKMLINPQAPMCASLRAGSSAVPVPKGHFVMVLWFHPSQAPSSRQPLAHCPVGSGRESEGERLQNSWD